MDITPACHSGIKWLSRYFNAWPTLSVDDDSSGEGNHLDKSEGNLLSVRTAAGPQNEYQAPMNISTSEQSSDYNSVYSASPLRLNEGVLPTKSPRQLLEASQSLLDVSPEAGSPTGISCRHRLSDHNTWRQGIARYILPPSTYPSHDAVAPSWTAATRPRNHTSLISSLSHSSYVNLCHSSSSHEDLVRFPGLAVLRELLVLRGEEAFIQRGETMEGKLKSNKWERIFGQRKKYFRRLVLGEAQQAAELLRMRNNLAVDGLGVRMLEISVG
ncbi:unnamed protein product [Protopolystoma xenopodis]|uniref:Uncharacterized protein n=1 Tax=Protopolystoma xenopodis TaxID=117903 RepID=A0A448WFD8_9PLAT|nr:unnamed protein product [Protopolystoma xenopodis]